MMFGIMLKGVNAVHFKSYVDFFFEFIPQTLFMLCTFFFMDMMIFYKWTIDWENDKNYAPPYIINIMINFLLALGGVCTEPGQEEANEGWLFGSCDGEKAFNQACIAIAVIMIPIMLLVKPFMLNS